MAALLPSFFLPSFFRLFLSFFLFFFENFRRLKLAKKKERKAIERKENDDSQPWVLLVFTGFYWDLLGFTGFCWFLPGFTGFYWFLPGFTGFYWVLTGF